MAAVGKGVGGVAVSPRHGMAFRRADERAREGNGKPGSEEMLLLLLLLRPPPFSSSLFTFSSL